MSSSTQAKRKMLSERRLQSYLKLAEIVQWGRKYPVRFVEEILGIPLLDFQRYVFMESWYRPNVLWVMSRNAGKALALDTPIPTPYGYTTMGELKVGDYVLDENGKPTKVTYTSDIFLGNKVFSLTFEDGEVINSDADHLWKVRRDIDKGYSVLDTRTLFREKNVLKNSEFYIPEPNFKNVKEKKLVAIKEIDTVPTKCISVENPSELFLCGNNNTVTHNTTLAAPFLMAKAMLIPNFQIYIIGGTGSQAQGAFKKIEDIALKRIASFAGTTDVFLHETVKTTQNKTGFSHNPKSFETRLFNGSRINTLNSVPDNVRGHRSSLNFYDESGFTDDEMFSATEPFLTQDSNFVLGGDVDASLKPRQFQNQRLLASSASTTDTYFYRKYKEFSKMMLLGHPDYFVADINAETVITATFNGKIYVPPLLSRDVVENKLRDEPEVGAREYMNIFTTEGSDQQIIKRATIIRNTELRVPELANIDDKSKYLIAIDPARSFNNSVMTIAKLVEDEEVGLKLEIVNSVSFVDVEKKKKTPIRTPEQIELFKQALIDYNGVGVPDYQNIVQVLIDSGSGGGGVSVWGDNLLDNWLDKNNRKRKGLIDLEHKEYKGYRDRYPDAVNKLTLTNHSNRKEFFESLKDVVNHDLISFTEYDGKRELVFMESDKNEEDVKFKTYRLSDDEEIALANIDLAKEELVSIYEYDNGRFDLSPDKKSKMSDDRAYTIAMLAWYLQKLRRKETVKQEDEIDVDNFVRIRFSGF